MSYDWMAQWHLFVTWTIEDTFSRLSQKVNLSEHCDSNQVTLTLVLTIPLRPVYLQAENQKTCEEV